MGGGILCKQTFSLNADLMNVLFCSQAVMVKIFFFLYWCLFNGLGLNYWRS